MRRVVNSLPTIKATDLSEPDGLESCLIRLGEDYPSVAFNLARSTRGPNQKTAIQSAAEGLSSQGGSYSIAKDSLPRHCGRLLDIEPTVMEAALIAFEARLNRVGSLTDAQSFYLKRLGETISGRRSLTAFLFFRLIGLGST